MATSEKNKKHLKIMIPILGIACGAYFYMQKTYFEKPPVTIEDEKRFMEISNAMKNSAKGNSAASVNQPSSAVNVKTDKASSTNSNPSQTEIPQKEPRKPAEMPLDAANGNPVNESQIWSQPISNSETQPLINQNWQRDESDPISEDEWNFVTQNLQEKFYVVAAGDSMSSISIKLFGKKDYWTKIWSLNTHIENPHELNVGMVLKLKSQPRMISNINE